MWCPKPKPKVIARPKPIFRQQQQQQQRRRTPESESNTYSEGQRKEKQHDPHRESRHYGMKHTDVTRIFLVEDRTCHVPSDQPYGLKKTDITRYLERVVPAHTFQGLCVTNNGQSQTTPRNIGNSIQQQPCKTDTLGDSRGAHPARPPSRCETRGGRNKLDASRENLRPETAPTGEMKRLTATNASTVTFLNKPASAGSSRRAMASSPLKPLEDARIGPPFKHGSNPGTAQTTSELEGLHGTEGGSIQGSIVGCALGGPGSKSMTASSHTSAVRLQPVPE